MKIYFLFLSLFLGQCVSQEGSVPEGVEDCYCGTVQEGDEAICAVWEKGANLAGHEEILAYQGGACGKSSCEKLSQGCKNTSPWTHKAPKFERSSVTSPCFCDEVVVKAEGKLVRVCASWQAGAKHLIEYYAIKDCKAESCQQAPFMRSKELCSLGFVPFYVK